MAGAVLWVLRARFFRFEVRRFGTAMGLSGNVEVRTSAGGALSDRASVVLQCGYFGDCFNFLSASQRGSISS